jgi:flagellin
MSLVINTNVASLNAQFNLSNTENALNTSLQQLSSGYQINTAADNPAGMVISEQQLAQIAGLNAAITNTSNATNIVQTADGALNEVDSLLTQIRSLAVDSANSGFNDASTLAANQAEVANALSTINTIANNTQFGTKALLNGNAGLTGATTNSAVTFLTAQPGASTSANAVDITTAGARATVAGVAQTSDLAADETLTINGDAISLAAGTSQAGVVNAINAQVGTTGVEAYVNGSGQTALYTTQYGSAASITVSSTTTDTTGDQSGFSPSDTVTGTDVAGTIGGGAATGVGNVLTGTAGAGAGISVAIGPASGATAHVDTAAGTLGTVTVTDNSLVFQLGANANQTASINLGNVTTGALGLNVSGNQFANLSDINVTTQSGAQASIQVIDQAINNVGTLQGELGAFQAITLQGTTQTLQATLQNTTAAESTIRDTDFAAATANYTQQSVLAQAGAAVLSNASQSSQLVLSLLQHI